MAIARGTPLFVYENYERQCPEEDCGAWYSLINRHGGVLSHMVTFHSQRWPTWRSACLGAMLQEAPADFKFECGPCLRGNVSYMIGLDLAGYEHMWAHSLATELTPLWMSDDLETLAGGEYEPWMRKREVRLSLEASLGQQVTQWCFPPPTDEFWLRRSAVEEYQDLAMWSRESWSDSDFGVHVRGETDEGVVLDNA